MDVGKRIRSLRKAAGYTQKELAEKSGVATVSIQQYERGVRQPRIDQLNRIASVFQVPLSHFVGVEPVEVQVADPNGVSKAQKDKWEKDGKNFCVLMDYLATIGFDLGYEVADGGEELYYALTSIEENKLYIISEEEVSQLMNCMQRYTSFLLQDIIKNKTPLTRAETTHQSPPAPQEGKDTTPPPDAPETPPEGE